MLGRGGLFGDLLLSSHVAYYNWKTSCGGELFVYCFYWFKSLQRLSALNFCHIITMWSLTSFSSFHLRYYPHASSCVFVFRIILRTILVKGFSLPSSSFLFSCAT